MYDLKLLSIIPEKYNFQLGTPTTLGTYLGSYYQFVLHIVWHQDAPPCRIKAWLQGRLTDGELQRGLN